MKKLQNASKHGNTRQKNTGKDIVTINKALMQRTDLMLLQTRV